MNNLQRLTFLPLALLVSCTVGPGYQAGDPAAAPGKFATSGADSASPGDISGWWRKFHEPKLNSLIERALAANQDLRIAISRVEEARAARAIARADYFPQVGVGGAATRTKGSEAATGVGGPPVNLFNLGVDASWEIDVFGGTRRAVEASTADLQAAGENARDVQVGLVGEVATAYLELRGWQTRKAVAERNLKSQRATLELTRSRQAGGVANDLDVARARAQMEATAASVPTFEAALRRSIYRIGVLLGGPPGSEIDSLLSSKGLPVAAPRVPVGLPSDLLRRRPDIRRSERQLAAATARIGVAVADLYPKFSLTGSAGRAALETGDLFKSGAGTWSLGPSLSWPVFTAGKIRNNIAVQNARQQQAAATYEKTVFLALEDVEGSLVSYGQEQKRLGSLTRSAEATRQAASLATDRYSAGLEDFLTVLDAERALLAAEDAQATSQTQVSLNLVRLYKALGGGWGDARVSK